MMREAGRQWETKGRLGDDRGGYGDGSDNSDGE